MKMVKLICIGILVIGGISSATAAEGEKVVSKDPPETITNKDDRKIIDRGTVIGKIKEIGKNFVEVTSENEKTARYIPEWKGGRTGGPDKRILKMFEKLKVGDSVRLEWYVNDHIRIKKIIKLKTE